MNRYPPDRPKRSRWISHLWVLQALADGAKVLSSEQAIRKKQLSEREYAYESSESTGGREELEEKSHCIFLSLSIMPLSN